MKNVFVLIVAFMACLNAFAQPGSRQVLSLDNGWRFNQGDIAMPIVRGHGMTYGSAKAGNAFGAAAPSFDDTEWRLLNLPHDWSVELPIDKNNNVSQGFRTRGIGWYRRNFKIPESDNGKHLELQFDGIATHCTVWVNGTVVHRNWCGYTSFYIDITPFAKYGEEVNNIAIRVDAVAQEGWWYEGAGIYRHTYLVTRNATHIITDGVFAQPVKQANNTWLIPAAVTLENAGKTDANVEVMVSLMDKNGKQIAQNKVRSNVSSLHKAVAAVAIPVSNPELWSLEKPTMYSVKTTVSQNGKIVDELTTTCGFRTIQFTADSGFYLNGKYVKIKGVCNHQDAAGVGVAVPASIWDYRIKKLKEMGANGYRCAHNPPAKEFLDACDRMGLLVMDENRNFNASPEYIRQLQWMLRRDRNHPSIILWSVFNEEPMQGTATGYEMVRRMRAEVKDFDTTRPVTAAMNGGQFEPVNVSQTVDVVGFNYAMWSYDRFHKENPTLPMTSSEDASAIGMRGEFKNDAEKHILSSYDTEKPYWGDTHRDTWKQIGPRRFVAGCFVWTGFDYRGEPTPFEWPTPDANFGIMDQCGFPKTAFWIHQAQWVEDKPVLQLVPHWNWPVDSIGKNIKVMAMSNAETVQLLLNGKVIGEQKVDIYEMNNWMVPYQPGKLEAIGYKGGKQVSKYTVETTSEAVALQLLPDRNYLANDGQDAMPITVQVVDAKGRPVPTSNISINFEVTGGGSNIGVANGNPNSLEMEKANTRKLYNGLAQITIQSKAGSTEQILVTATADGLKAATASIKINAVTPIATVPIANRAMVIDNGWRISPFATTKPDANVEISDNDMNSWTSTNPGNTVTFADGIFAVYRTNFKPFAAQQKQGAKMTLKNVTGKAEVYIDKQLVATKTSAAPADISFQLPPKQGNRTISVLIETEKGTKAGLGGVVIVETN